MVSLDTKKTHTTNVEKFRFTNALLQVHDFFSSSDTSGVVTNVAVSPITQSSLFSRVHNRIYYIKGNFLAPLDEMSKYNDYSKVNIRHSTHNGDGGELTLGKPSEKKAE